MSLMSIQGNSRPGHRKLLAQLARLSRVWLATVCDAIVNQASA